MWSKPSSHEGQPRHMHSTESGSVADRYGEHFSVVAMISTMISLDAYEKLTRLGRDLAPGSLALRGSIGKGIGHGN